MAEQQAPRRTTPRGWLFLATFFGLLGIGGWGIASHNGVFEAIGFLPILLALLIFKIISDRRAKRDPEYARRIEVTKAQARTAQLNPRQTMTSVGLAVAGVTAAMLGRKYIPGFESLPREQQKTYLVIGLIVANVLGFIVYLAWKARRARKSSPT